MKKLMRKAVTVLGSFALVGATISAAAAATYPAPFDSGNYAVVYGSSDDMAATNTIANGLPDMSTSGTLEGGTGVTEDEVVLGGQIDATGYKIESTMTDAKIPSLLDEKISWDDGLGSDDIDIHESIIIGDMAILTSLNDEDLEGVAMSNNMGLEYRYYFDDSLNQSGVGDDEADTLYLDIMGKSYEVEGMTNSTITVVTSEEVSLAIGGTYTTDEGKTVTLTDVYEGSVEVSVDGKTEVINLDSTERVNGVRVNVQSIGYHQNTPETSKAVLKIGADISKTYTDGDEFVGQDEDDPLWVWDISNPGYATGYIGVKYNANINDADDEEAGDMIKYVGEAYVMPNNFAQVSLDGLTDVTYEDVVVSFEQKDLYNSSDSGTANEDKWVIKIKAEDTSSITVGSEETDELYIWYENNESAMEGANTTYGALDLFYRDHEGDYTPTNKARYEERVNLTGNAALGRTNLATIEVGDTTVDLDFVVAAGAATLIFENPMDADINLSVRGNAGALLTNSSGDFRELGSTIEDADAGDIFVNGTDVSTKDASIMDYYGIIVARDDSDGVEGNANADEVTLSVPSDQVYAIVSVTAGGTAAGDDSGQKTFMDTESGYSGKNVVVVGGSCVNSVAATLLGGDYCGDAFTGATSVGPGEFLIQTFDYNGKVATLVAGYEKEDTAKAATYLANEGNAVMTDVGTKYVGQTATEQAVEVS